MGHVYDDTPIELTDHSRIILLGVWDTYNVKSVSFNIQPWIERYGTGDLIVLHERPNEGLPFEVDNVEIQDGIATWTFSAFDTARAGTGSCALIYTVNGEFRARTAPWQTRIIPTIGPQGETPPDPLRTWYDAIMAASAAAVESKDAAEGSATAAAGSAAEAAESATNADTAKTAAQAAQQAAEGARGAAEGSATAAAGSAAEAAGSATEARLAKDAAEIAASNAQSAADSVAVLDFISVTPPAKRYYASISEALDLTGMAVTAAYTNGASYARPLLLCESDPAEGAVFDATGMKTVTVTYRELGVSKTDSFAVSVAAGPIITRQPEDVTAKVDTVVVFSVAAQGDALTYQWQYSADGGESWTNSGYSSATTEILRMTALARFSGYLYRCVVTDGGALSVTSEAAMLTTVEE